MDIKIRKATTNDASVIAQVISLGFGEDMMRQYCGENGVSIIEALAKMEVSQYSYRHALIAEVDGQAAGAIVGYDGAQLQELREPTLAYIYSQAGFMPQIQNETEAGEFYLDTLAVFPAYRHQGIGKALILALCEKAFNEGHQRVAFWSILTIPKPSIFTPPSAFAASIRKHSSITNFGIYKGKKTNSYLSLEISRKEITAAEIQSFHQYRY